MKYLLDSNTFIEAKNKYYGMDICPGYWQWIDNKYSSGDVASISMVKSELMNGNDELALWAKDKPHIFLEVSDPNTQVAYSQIATYVMGLPNIKDEAKEDFLKGADPWLIAKAQVIKSTVVTHEQRNPDVRRKVLIPNICLHYGINCIDTFSLLRNLSAQFHLDHSA